MQLIPMDAPAEIHRRNYDAAGRVEPGDVTVARGPLVIMAYGILSIAPSERDGFWITGAFGDMTAEQAEAVLHRWETARPH